MVTVRDVMTANPITIGPQATLRDAVELLAAHGISGVPVVDGQELVGTLSALDLIDFEAAQRAVPAAREQPEPIEDWGPAAEENQPGVFLDHWEDAGVDAVERMECSDSPEWDFLAEHRVVEAMATEPRTFAPSDPVQVVADFMQASGLHSALVADERELVGIVTTMDITRTVASTES